MGPTDGAETVVGEEGLEPSVPLSERGGLPINRFPNA